jgi:hypothetical protein
MTIHPQLERECAAAELAHAAEQYATVVALVRHGEATQEVLRARRAALEDAARRFAAAEAGVPAAPEHG